MWVNPCFLLQATVVPCVNAYYMMQVTGAGMTLCVQLL